MAIYDEALTLRGGLRVVLSEDFHQACSEAVTAATGDLARMSAEGLAIDWASAMPLYLAHRKRAEA